MSVTFWWDEKDGMRKKIEAGFDREGTGVEISVNGKYLGTLDLYYYTDEWGDEEKAGRDFPQFVIHAEDSDDPVGRVRWLSDRIVLDTERKGWFNAPHREAPPMRLREMNWESVLEPTIVYKLRALSQHTYAETEGADGQVRYMDFEEIVAKKHTPTGDIFYGWTATVEFDKDSKVKGVWGTVSVNLPHEGWGDNDSIPLKHVGACAISLRNFARTLTKAGVGAIVKGIKLEYSPKGGTL